MQVAGEFVNVKVKLAMDTMKLACVQETPTENVAYHRLMEELVRTM